MLAYRLWRWSNIYWSLDDCVVFAGMPSWDVETAGATMQNREATKATFSSKQLLANTTHWHGADLMLGQRRRRWHNIKSAPGQCVVSGGTPANTMRWLGPPMLVHSLRYMSLGITQKTRDPGPMLVQGWASVVDDRPTLHQHWPGSHVCWKCFSNAAVACNCQELRRPMEITLLSPW